MIEKLKQALSGAQKIVLIGHKNPDGDAVGSTLALSSVLTNMGKDVKVIYPTMVPPYLMWLHGAEDAYIYEKNEEQTKIALDWADFLVMLDHNAPSRVGDMEAVLPTDKPLAMIDHHPHPAFETELLFSDTTVSSTCELLTRIIYDMQWENYIDKDAATALFVGIITDTGKFSHNSSNPETYRIVANLLEKDVEKDEVISRIYDDFSEDRMRLMGHLLNNILEVFHKQGLAIMYLSMEDKEKYNYQVGDGEGWVNIPFGIKGVKRSIYMQEYPENIRISFRSKGDIAINEIAAEHFEGGGHKNAAGGTSYESLSKTLDKIKTLFGVKSNNLRS